MGRGARRHHIYCYFLAYIYIYLSHQLITSDSNTAPYIFHGMCTLAFTFHSLEHSAKSLCAVKWGDHGSVSLIYRLRKHTCKWNLSTQESIVFGFCLRCFRKHGAWQLNDLHEDRISVKETWSSEIMEKKFHNHYKPGWEGKAWTPAEAHLPCTNDQRSKSAVFDSSRESGRGVFRCSLCLWRYQMWDVQGNGEGESVTFGKVALTVSAPGKVWKIELNLIPPLI